MPSHHPFTSKDDGFLFANDFPAGTKAISWLPLSIFGLRFNDAGDGLCGGMVFAAIDYHQRDIPRPPDQSPPAAGKPLFRYMVRRLIGSWGIPLGVLRYLFLMNPLVSDRHRARVSAKEANKVAAAVGGGRPVPLGLVRVKSWNPSNLRNNHQVAAWGVVPDGTGLRFSVYDPNEPGTDVALGVSSTDPKGPVQVTYGAEEPVLSFFAIRYRSKQPPEA